MKQVTSRVVKRLLEGALEWELVEPCGCPETGTAATAQPCSRDISDAKKR